mmetsp:Transcript_11522/g.28181  ORF Transcript_11522/g.28181 Transcript_11522/m.28181 type:complete len:222 (-) Transcript_11522:3112-3777(-)
MRTTRRRGMLCWKMRKMRMTMSCSWMRTRRRPLLAQQAGQATTIWRRRRRAWLRAWSTQTTRACLTRRRMTSMATMRRWKRMRSLAWILAACTCTTCTSRRPLQLPPLLPRQVARGPPLVQPVLARAQPRRLRLRQQQRGRRPGGLLPGALRRLRQLMRLALRRARSSLAWCSTWAQRSWRLVPQCSRQSSRCRWPAAGQPTAWRMRRRVQVSQEAGGCGT